MLPRVRLQRLLAWLLLLVVAGGGVFLIGGIRSNYIEVAHALAKARAVRPVFVSAQFIAKADEINVDISFRIDTNNAHVPLFFDALAYTLVVLDPDGDIITEGSNSAQGIYIGRYSYWGNRQALPSSELVFRSPSVMKSLYRDRLMAEARAGRRKLAALGELTLEVETKFGRQTLAIPFNWQFSLATFGRAK